MKRILALAIIFALVCSFAACGGSGEDKPVTSGDAGNTQASGDDTGTTKEPLQNGSEFTEVSLVNNDQITVTIVDFKPNAADGPEFSLFFENKTEFPLTFSLEGASINGYMLYASMYTDVAAGKTAYGTVSWYTENLIASGINYIETFAGVLSVNDYTDFSKDALYDDYFEIEVNGGSGEAVKEPTFSGAIAEQTLVSEGGLLIVAKDYVVDKYGDAKIIVYIENNTGKNIGVCGDDDMVNGVMCNLRFNEIVFAGKKCYGSIKFGATALAESHIETVNTVGLTLEISDTDKIEYIMEKVVTINIA